MLQGIAVAVVIGGLVVGSSAVVHGVKKAGKAVVHAVHHPKKSKAAK